ncbi:MAG: DUF1963 domain-containing protein [Clostridia bacterium]|nr:DUF1963 domain-containing protein [Clostridia bacterium]
MKRKIAIGLMIFLMAGVIALYLVEIFVQGISPLEHLPRFALIFLGMVLALVRLLTASSAPCPNYEKHFARELDGAFIAEPAARKKLLKAVRFYNEDKMVKAVKLLNKLQPRAARDQDAVLMFKALCYTDLHYPAEAVNCYKELLEVKPHNSTAWSNMGMQYQALGLHDKAEESYRKAVECDPQNPYAHNNLAGLCYRRYACAEAKEHAHRALELNGNLHQAASLLALLYAAEGEQEKSERYFHQAVAAGKKAEELRAAIERVSFDRRELYRLTEAVEEWRKTTARPAVYCTLDGEGKSMIGGGLNESPPCDAEGKELVFLAAIYCSELPPVTLLPRHGILRFYIEPDGGESCKVLFTEDEAALWAVETDQPENHPVCGCYRLRFSHGEEAMPFADGGFEPAFDALLEQKGLPRFRHLDEDSQTRIVDALSHEAHKLGGYADFIQEDPREGEEQDYLLLQLISEYVRRDIRVMFGDMGNAHFFIGEQALRNKDFSDVLFHWDCY